MVVVFTYWNWDIWPLNEQRRDNNMLQVANSRIYIHIYTRKTLYSYVRQWRGASESGLIMAEAARDWFRSHNLLDHYNRNAALWEPIDFGSHTLFIHFPRYANLFFFSFIHWLPTVARNDMKQKNCTKKEKQGRKRKEKTLHHCSASRKWWLFVQWTTTPVWRHSSKRSQHIWNRMKLAPICRIFNLKVKI